MAQNDIVYGKLKGQRKNLGQEALDVSMDKDNIKDLFSTDWDTSTGAFSKMMAPINDLLWGTPPGIMTQEIIDPIKQRVASPLSQFLESQIGKGLPMYEDKLAHEFTTEEKRAYSDFLALDAGEWFQKAVADPATKEFKEELLPTIQEGFAGSLRGSGRFRAEEAGINKFTEQLTQARYMAEKDIPQAQFAMAVEYKRNLDINYARKYSAWMASLPQANPAITQALQFLQESTETGTTILTMEDPGERGLIGDILGIFGG